MKLPWRAKLKLDWRSESSSRSLALAGLGMAKRIAPFAVVSCVLLAAFGAVSRSLCQSLADAPLVQGLTSAPKATVFVDEARSASKFGVMDGKATLQQSFSTFQSELVTYAKQQGFQVTS